MNKRTLVIGASEKAERYSNKAVISLVQNGHEVIALGRKEGRIKDEKIVTQLEGNENIHTISVYIGIDHQDNLIETIKDVKPSRVIFNPGTENYDLCTEISKMDIECVNACTLVMLSIGNY